MATESKQEQQFGRLIDGKQIAATIHAEVKQQVEDLKQRGYKAGLAVILVGDRKDSLTYVNNKKKACAEVGIVSYETTLPATISQQEVEAVIQQYNENPLVHGILVQLPLPDHLNTRRVLACISPSKDVDGLLPISVGQLALRDHNPTFICCTPLGCVTLLDRYGVEIDGKHAVVIGRSNMVGLPLSLLLLRRNATVTVCHSKTHDLPSVVGQADIVIAAIGKARFVRGEWIKPGAVVIDVGINAVDDPSSARGYRLVGDVDFESARLRASLITPVPGGVGPMTIAMLLSNTVKGATAAYGLN